MAKDKSAEKKLNRLMKQFNRYKDQPFMKKGRLMKRGKIQRQMDTLINTKEKKRK